MSADDIQNIILALFLIAIFGGLFLFMAVFFIYVFFQTSKRKKIRQRVLATQTEFVGTHRWLPVRYASEPRFRSWLKIFPWEGAGIVVLMPGSVTFLGETNSGASVQLQFAPGNATVNWIGKSPFPNGAVSWLDFTTASGKHYFSSETGAFVFGSDNSTRELFMEASKCFSGA
jgi:hypothetical protein